MRRREWTHRVQDILDAIARVQRYTEDMEPELFARDDKTVDAVIYNVAVIGEAARHIPLEVEARHPEVPWAKMRGMRNIVVHEYFGVGRAILWETARGDLPPLIPLLESLLESESAFDE